MVREVRTFPQPELIPWFFERLDCSAQATQALVWVALIAIGVVALSAFAALA